MTAHYARIFIDILALIGAYPFFCVLLVDPEGRALAHVGHPLWGLHTSVEYRNDPTFQFFSLAALYWTIAFVLVALFNPKYCSAHPETLRSRQTLFALATVMIATKIFVGPILETRKSIRLVGERKFTQPFSFMIYDAARVWLINIKKSASWKFITVTIIFTPLV